MKTYMPGAKTIERKWYVVDAEGKTLGRLATQVATVLRGKHKIIALAVNVALCISLIAESHAVVSGRVDECREFIVTVRHIGLPAEFRNVQIGIRTELIRMRRIRLLIGLDILFAENRKAFRRRLPD